MKKSINKKSTFQVQSLSKSNAFDICCDIGMSIAWGLVMMIVFGTMMFSYVFCTNTLPADFMKFDLIMLAFSTASIVYYLKEQQVA